MDNTNVSIVLSKTEMFCATFIMQENGITPDAVPYFVKSILTDNEDRILGFLSEQLKHNNIQRRKEILALFIKRRF